MLLHALGTLPCFCFTLVLTKVGLLIHLVETGAGQKADRVNEELLVLWKAKQTAMQGREKVSRMNGHSSNRLHGLRDFIFPQLLLNFLKSFCPLFF